MQVESQTQAPRRQSVPRARWRNRLLIAFAFACAAGTAAAEDNLYYFIDETGTPHFSNVPADKRYKPYRPDAGGTSRPGKAGAGPALPGAALPGGPVPPLDAEAPVPDVVDEDRDEREPPEPLPPEPDR